MIQFLFFFGIILWALHAFADFLGYLEFRKLLKMPIQDLLAEQQKLTAKVEQYANYIHYLTEEELKDSDDADMHRYFNEDLKLVNRALAQRAQ